MYQIIIINKHSLYSNCKDMTFFAYGEEFFLAQYPAHCHTENNA